jgi:hypothetical protein
VICCGLKVSSPNPTRCRSQGVEGTLAATLRVVPVGKWESRLRATGPSAKRRRHLGTGRRPPRPAVNMGSTLPRTTGKSTQAASPPITPRSWSARTQPRKRVGAQQADRLASVSDPCGNRPGADRGTARAGQGRRPGRGSLAGPSGSKTPYAPDQLATADRKFATCSSMNLIRGR